MCYDNATKHRMCQFRFVATDEIVGSFHILFFVLYTIFM